MSVAIPMVNATYLYIDGLQLAWISTTVIDIFSGTCRDGTNVNDITLSAATTSVTTTVQGAGGIDTGTVAASTLYAVYAIDSSLGAAPGSAIYSLNQNEPVLPLGYDMSRRIGFVLTDGSSDFLKFDQTGNANGISCVRRMWYDAGIPVLNAGSSATFADVDCSASMPAIQTTVVFNAVLTPTGNGNTATVQPKGATDAGGYVVIGGSQAAVALHSTISVPCNSSAFCSYKVTGTLTLLLRAYDDNL